MEKNNILILAAHPDDETLGCGGTILKYASEGYKVFCLAMTNGVNSREYKKCRTKSRRCKRLYNRTYIRSTFWFRYGA